MSNHTCYADFITAEAKAIKSDGCTLVSELFRSCCLEHDCTYYYAKDPRSAYRHYRERPDASDYWHLADPITRRDADARMRSCIQQKAPFKRFSPIAWIRWAGVRAGGWKPWGKYRKAA